MHQLYDGILKGNLEHNQSHAIWEVVATHTGDLEHCKQWKWLHELNEQY